MIERYLPAIILLFLFILVPAVKGAASDRAGDPGGHTDVLACEFPNEIIPAIRKQKKPPLLILFSADPFLQPVPAELRLRAADLVASGTREDIQRFGNLDLPDPVLLPQKTVRALLENGLIQGADWILPIPIEVPFLTVDQVRSNLERDELATREETGTLRQTGAGVAMTIAARPFRFNRIDRLAPPPDQSLWVHIDLSYIAALYRNEIKTPIFPLVGKMIRTLAPLRSRIKGFSVSFSTERGDVPLTLRFVGPVLKRTFADPTVLEKVPFQWVQVSRVFYYQEFHQIGEIDKLVNKLLQASPDRAVNHYLKYRLETMRHDPDRALAALREAIRLDRGYAVELFPLADREARNGNLAAAIPLLAEALAARHEHDVHRINLAELNLQFRDPAKARSILEPLSKLPWSKVYHPQTPDLIKQLLKAADQTEKFNFQPPEENALPFK
ncbi:MAG: hypothetical protein D6751_11585 [Deltaproteobacteria bacterium]|nr:MAG: hypothetical protein D6751_11585 [Deltaproteobacteria bacterium]